ncbi:hypothetical protein K439DRAFT_1614890 [Ramaria rubella]|nr:hypothetical protein K439DRAFT_1614890 [Ramaria rubella]
MGIMLAPYLNAYRGEDVMCELNITGVLDCKDKDKITAVIKEIRAYAIEFRNSTKTAVFFKGPLVNLASFPITENIKSGDDKNKLTHQIVGMPNIHAAMTLPVVIHIAFLHMVIAENPTDTWLALDWKM